MQDTDNNMHNYHQFLSCKHKLFVIANHSKPKGSDSTGCCMAEVADVGLDGTLSPSTGYL